MSKALLSSAFINKAALLAVLALPLGIQQAQAAEAQMAPLSDAELSDVRAAFADTLLGPLMSGQLSAAAMGTTKNGEETTALQALLVNANTLQRSPPANAEQLLKTADLALKPAVPGLPSLAAVLPMLTLVPLVPIMPVLALQGLLPPPKSCGAAHPC